MKRPDLTTLTCVNPACQMLRRPAGGHLVMRTVYGQDQIRLLRCRPCGEEFAERRGSALCNTKLPETTAADGISHLDAGWSVRATARLVQVAQATVTRLVRVAGRHAERCHDQPGHGSTPTALACDAQGSLVKKHSGAAKPTRWRGLARCGTPRR